jgi:peptidoglycan hydrolase-like protein with peptidoglycan-binding domain
MGGQELSMNNVGGHIAILAGAGVAAALLGLATYIGQRMETAASAQAPVVVTVPARPTQPTAPPTQRQPSMGAALFQDPTALARQLQSELKRVGCYDGEISGVWTPRTREAMKAFTTRVNATLPVDKPDHILLALLQGHHGVACAPKPVLAKAPAKPEPPEADAAPGPIPAIVPPIVAAAPKLLPPPSSVTPAAPKTEPSLQVPTHASPTREAPQAQAPAAPTPPGERPLRSLRHGGPVPEVGVYERRPRRSARSYRQVRYARALIRSLQRAAMTPWRLP